MENLKTSVVHRNLEKKPKLLGMEMQDLIFVALLASIFNLIFGKTILGPYLTFGVPTVLSVILFFSKRDKPDNYLVHCCSSILHRGFTQAGKNQTMTNEGEGGFMSSKAGYAPLVDLLPFWHLEDDGLIVFQDGSLGCGFRITGADVESWTNNKINALSEHLENLLVSAQEGVSLQFFYNFSPYVGDILKAHENISKDAPSKYFAIRKARLDYFQGKALSKGFFRPEIYCFVRGAFP